MQPRLVLGLKAAFDMVTTAHIVCAMDVSIQPDSNGCINSTCLKTYGFLVTNKLMRTKGVTKVTLTLEIPKSRGFSWFITMLTYCYAFVCGC